MARNSRAFTLFCGALLITAEWLTPVAVADADEMDGMMMMTAPEGASDATIGYVAAMNAMSMGMAVPFTGNADVDFIKGMIPHHQGAVDAAKIVLEYGEDPEVRAFATEIIAAQEKEIAWMKEWLAANGQ
jgi:uncharacterized protein (DUF305 family)